MRGIHRATLTLAMVSLMACAASAGAAAAKVVSVHDLVVAPGNGAKPGSPVRVSLRVANGYPLGAVKVTLNGRDISSYFRTAVGGRRTALVSPSQGLRFGHNTLSVSVRPSHGATRRQTVHFTIRRRGLLAAAGPDLRAAVGRPVPLDGSSTLAAATGRRGGRGRRAPIRLAWKLVGRPRGSHVRLRGRLIAYLASGKPASPTFKADRLGRYTVRLTAGDGAQRSTDTATLDATLESSEVPIDTAVNGTGPGGQKLQGIAIGYHPAADGYRQPNTSAGEQFYPLAAGDAAQIVIVGRQDLSPVSSASYPAGESFVAAAQSALANLPDTDLAIVTTWPSAAWTYAAIPVFGPGAVLAQLTGSNGALNDIGASQISLQTATATAAMEQSTLSWIGVNGLPAGSDWERFGGGNFGAGGPSGLGASNGLDGFLEYDPAGNYTYIPKEGVPFDLGADNGQTATLAVGTTQYTGSLPAGSMGGFAVMVLHAGSLQPYNIASPSAPGSGTPTVFSTRNSDGTPNYGPGGSTYTGQDGITGMSLLLEELQYQKVYEPLVVLIRSIGAPFTPEGLQPENNYQGSYDATLAEALDRLSFDVASFGGHEEWLLRMAIPGPASTSQSYSEVGRNHSAEGDATVADTGSGVTPAVPSTELSGRLARTNRSLFRPQLVVNSPSVPNPLTPLVTSEPVAWPDTATAAERLGVQCAGESVQLGSDPRYEYWNLTTKASDWSTYQQTLSNVHFATAQTQYGCSGLQHSAFTAAKTELLLEFGWMKRLKDYMSELAAPYTSDSTQTLGAVQTAVTAVKTALPLPPAAPVGLNGAFIGEEILGIFADIATVGGYDEASGIISALGGSLGLWGDMAGDDGGATPVFAQRNKIETTGAEVVNDLLTRLEGVASGSQGMTEALASDYQRLKTVGSYENCVPAVQPPQVDPNCPVGWELPSTEGNDAMNSFTLSARRAAWGALLPAAWPYALYMNSNPGSFNGTFNGPQEQIASIGCDFAAPFEYPTGKALGQGQAYIRWDFRSDPSSSEGPNTKFIVIANGNFHGASSQFNFPPVSLFTQTPLFTAVNSEENFVTGPLGMDEYQFLMDNWQWNAPKGPQRNFWVGC